MLNIPSSVVSANPPSAPMVSRIVTPSRVPQLSQHPSLNSHMGGGSMHPIAFSNVRSQFVPPTSRTTRGYCVPILHNISHCPLPVVQPGGHIGICPIGPTS